MGLFNRPGMPLTWFTVLHRGKGLFFLLLDDFPIDEANPLTSPRTADPGPGIGTIVDTGNVLDIVGGEIVPNATTTGTGDPAYLDPVARVRNAGLCIYGDIRNYSALGAALSSVDLGWSKDGIPASGDLASVRLDSNRAGVFTGGVTNGSLTIYANDNLQKFMVIVRDEGAFFVDYDNLIMMWIDNADVTDPIYAALITTVFNRAPFGVSTLRVAQLPTPWNVDNGIALNDASFIDVNDTLLSALTNEKGGDWDAGAQWTVQGNKANNAPVGGAEQVVNGGMEGVYDDESGGGGGTVNVAPDWNEHNVEKDGSDTLDKETTIVHSGLASQYINVNANAEGITTAANVFVANKWYLVSLWLYAVSGSVRVVDSSGFFLAETVTPPADWTNYEWPVKAIDAQTLLIRSGSGAAAEFYVDDVSVKELAIADLISSVQSGENEVHIFADVVVVAGTQAGIVTHLDSQAAPANFLICYYDGTNLHLEKNVGGTYTELINAAAAGGRVYIITYRDGANLKVRAYSNNALIGTEQTIADAGIVDNTLHGLFSAYSGNTLDNFSVYPRAITGSAKTILDEVANA